eukprot:scaffold10220_cov144-Isochrysis_galbana.AAC.15
MATDGAHAHLDGDGVQKVGSGQVGWPDALRLGEVGEVVEVPALAEDLGAHCRIRSHARPMLSSAARVLIVRNDELHGIAHHVDEVLPLGKLCRIAAQGVEVGSVA